MTLPTDENPALRAQRIDDEALAWFLRRQERSDAETERAFAAWAATSAQHQQAYERWAAEWQALDAVPAHARLALRAKPARGRAPACRQRRWWLGAGLAAGAAWLAAGSRPWWADDAAVSTRYTTAVDEWRPLVLPDGSRAELDAASALSVVWGDSRHRLVLPAGRAWFDLRAGRAQPVDILAGPARVRAADTQLTVRHLVGSLAGWVEVAVLRGEARVHATVPAWRQALPFLGGDDIRLGAGEQVRLSAEGRSGPVRTVDPARAVLWRERQIALDDVTLADALAEFARYGHAPARLADARAGALRLSGIFDALRPERFYQVLPEVLPVRVRPEGQGVVIASVT